MPLLFPYLWVVIGSLRGKYAILMEIGKRFDFTALTQHKKDSDDPILN